VASSVNSATIIFYVFAAWAVVSAVLCITRSNALTSALWLVSTMFALAAIFVILQAQFIAAIQVLVYAGAVMVLFLFVIMLLNLEVVPHNWQRRYGWVVGIGLAAVLGATLVTLKDYTPERLAREISTMPGVVDPRLVFPEGGALATATATQGAVGSVAQPLFQGYLVPFEITSVLLLAAVVGAVVLAKKKL
jgi:NADH-quinone oxidoreductase subunit J